MAIYSVMGVGEHGKFFDENSYIYAINYIRQGGNNPYVGMVNLTSIETAAAEMQATAASFEKDSGKRLRHTVLSFHESEHVTSELAYAYAQQIIQHYAPEYQMVFAVHTNTENPHIHFVMNQISYVDGHRYKGQKRDYYDFRNHIASVIHHPVLLVKNAHPEK